MVDIKETKIKITGVVAHSLIGSTEMMNTLSRLNVTLTEHFTAGSRW